MKTQQIHKKREGNHKFDMFEDTFTLSMIGVVAVKSGVFRVFSLCVLIVVQFIMSCIRTVNSSQLQETNLKPKGLWVHLIAGS